MRGRAVWGVVVPFDSVWRTGANLATIFSTESDLVSGNVKIPKGSYTLYSIPAEKGLTLIMSKRPGGSQPQYDMDPTGHGTAAEKRRLPPSIRSGSGLSSWTGMRSC